LLLLDLVLKSVLGVDIGFGFIVYLIDPKWPERCTCKQFDNGVGECEALGCRECVFGHESWHEL